MNNAKDVCMIYNVLRSTTLEFFCEDYRWELGIAIVNELLYNTGKEFDVVTDDDMPTLFGIPVKVNYNDPYKLKIYEDITNKIGRRMDK